MAGIQYLGRVYDMLALRGAVPRGEIMLTQTLFDSTSPGEVCTGVQKLAQRWIMEFMTLRGSMGFHLADRGTDFMRVVRQGGLRNELDVQMEYNFAAVLVRQNLLAEENEAMHPEDRFQQDELTNILIGPSYLQLSIRLTSLAGDSAEVILPIKYTPTNLAL